MTWALYFTSFLIGCSASSSVYHEDSEIIEHFNSLFRLRLDKNSDGFLQDKSPITLNSYDDLLINEVDSVLIQNQRFERRTAYIQRRAVCALGKQFKSLVNEGPAEATQGHYKGLVAFREDVLAALEAESKKNANEVEKATKSEYSSAEKAVYSTSHRTKTSFLELVLHHVPGRTNDDSGLSDGGSHRSAEESENDFEVESDGKPNENKLSKMALIENHSFLEGTAGSNSTLHGTETTDSAQTTVRSKNTDSNQTTDRSKNTDSNQTTDRSKTTDSTQTTDNTQTADRDNSEETDQTSKDHSVSQTGDRSTSENRGGSGDSIQIILNYVHDLRGSIQATLKEPGYTSTSRTANKATKAIVSKTDLTRLHSVYARQQDAQFIIEELSNFYEDNIRSMYDNAMDIAGCFYDEKVELSRSFTESSHKQNGAKIYPPIGKITEPIDEDIKEEKTGVEDKLKTLFSTKKVISTEGDHKSDVSANKAELSSFLENETDSSSQFTENRADKTAKRTNSSENSPTSDANESEFYKLIASADGLPALQNYPTNPEDYSHQSAALLTSAALSSSMRSASHVHALNVLAKLRKHIKKTLNKLDKMMATQLANSWLLPDNQIQSKKSPSKGTASQLETRSIVYEILVKDTNMIFTNFLSKSNLHSTSEKEKVSAQNPKIDKRQRSSSTSSQSENITEAKQNASSKPRFHQSEETDSLDGSGNISRISSHERQLIHNESTDRASSFVQNDEKKPATAENVLLLRDGLLSQFMIQEHIRALESMALGITPESNTEVVDGEEDTLYMRETTNNLFLALNNLAGKSEKENESVQSQVQKDSKDKDNESAKSDESHNHDNEKDVLTPDRLVFLQRQYLHQSVAMCLAEPKKEWSFFVHSHKSSVETGVDFLSMSYLSPDVFKKRDVDIESISKSNSRSQCYMAYGLSSPLKEAEAGRGPWSSDFCEKDLNSKIKEIKQ